MNKSTQEDLFKSIRDAEKVYSIRDKNVHTALSVITIIVKTVITAIVLVLVLIGVITLTNSELRNQFISLI